MSNLYQNNLKRFTNSKSQISKLYFQKDIQKLALNENGELDDEKLNKLQLDNKLDIESISDLLTNNLNKQLKQMSSDKAIKLLEWINTWEFYLDIEESFDLTKRRTYKRGDIVHVNFGFNVHNELGGTHYALVIEADNAPTNGTIVVVPLKSTQEDNPTNLADSEVFLGKNIIPVGKAHSRNTIAKVGQIKAISKLRIMKPTNDKDTVYPIDPEIRTSILNLIDKKVKEMFIKFQNTID